MLNKLLRAINGTTDAPDWESMLTRMGPDSLHTESSGASEGASTPNEALVAAPNPAAPDVNLALLGLSGNEVHERALKIANELHRLAEQGATVQQWNLLIRDVTALANLGQNVKSLAEIKLRRVKPRVKVVALLPLVGGVLAKRANDLRRSGVLLVPELQACSVDADTNLSKALIETGIEWALPFGNRLTVRTDISPWGDTARIAIVADAVVKTQDEAPPVERTGLFLWELIAELSEAAGVMVSRSQANGTTAMTIEFPIHNDTQGDIPSRELRMQVKDTPQLAKLDVVIYASSQSIKIACDRALIRTESRVRFASNIAHLVRECELQLPAAMVVESEMMDHNVKELISDLRRHVKTFAVIEIVQAANVFDVSLPGSNNPCRLSVASIENKLSEALTFELAQS